MTPSFDLHGAINELGDPDSWTTPTGYPNSLALCVIDAIWSLGIRYATVENVLARYVAIRVPDGHGSTRTLTDTPRDFLDWYHSMNDASSAAHTLGNFNLTSTTNGILKVEAAAMACRLLDDEGISTPGQLLVHAERIQPRWTSEVRGQRSGISWHYLLMLAGADGVKPDRMVHRFMRRFGAPADLTAGQFVDEIKSALGAPVTSTMIDHRIWMIERQNQPESSTDDEE